MDDLNIDEVIQTLADGKALTESVIVKLLMKIMEVFMMEGNVLELQSPITICGDIHGQLYDLFELFDTAGDITNQKFLFMGDYVDRGYYSLETIFYLCALKLKYPTQFFLLRGNHECRAVNQLYGFYAECLMRYGHAGIWMMCNDMFDLLPMAAVIDNSVFSIHGGLSPSIPLIEKISTYDRNDELPAVGPLCDLCWSDPDTVKEWKVNQRGAGYLFGERQVSEFCQLNNLQFVTRSHQIAMDGFKWFFNHKLVTVWSAPNYMYRSNNMASIMKYEGPDKDPILVTFGPRDENKRVVPEETTSGYFL
ncbi:Ser/Thr protein phosphatase [Tritrichomonas foetus]|uniref:Serine/threonine-protein phosphatase n=1 Tax=Tritrichomonas foetus TaxID=1144522 RepID=A0A1J4KW07_9EUKA|nr:Ser/Thr protein phosphatase [Tritrichomonas foetus]|eukprot:OHT15415.1 Ser/Thr protein phosphatase [Tritrichomonas foetus]